MAAAMDVDTPSGTNSGAGKKRFEVKKWNAVALWAWDIVVDNCAICRNHIMDLSCFSLPLHLSLAQNTAGVSVGQQRVGIPKVWALEREFFRRAQLFCYSFNDLPSCYLIIN
ncbi:PREDICTED: E3 ubiquitin-protein ligase RBX1 isoform X2 [Odobenus rosmarus divergens]|uniref:E3 ubiquitin-protein ligase RBX1 isoform X2 n=1 Tax=Odobenus rosmarus divergens TaxID=9708 RepID=A0A2U3VQL4_ODORO|nr:PREDICTED: E3 ubiquitin-protein ligase RBX1 isoform X2 [Odobenus rosmarus divergens]